MAHIPISLCGGGGSGSDDCSGTKAELLEGYTGILKGSDDEPVEGTLPDHSGTTKSATSSLDTTNNRLQMTVPSAGKYNTSSKLYATYSAIRTLIGLTAAKIAVGNKILGLDGSYKGLGDATIGNVLSGKKFSSASLSNATGSMPNNGTVTKTLDPGGSYTIKSGYHSGAGKITAKSKHVKQLEAQAYRGFGMVSSDYEAGYEQSFTMPEAGTVYYNGLSACSSTSRNVVCEIYKNGTLVDSRNMTNSENSAVRGTMVARSFSAAKGDVIKVVAKATSGTNAIAVIDATIVYFA